MAEKKAEIKAVLRDVKLGQKMVEWTADEMDEMMAVH